jgi:8-oxo-dGTP diphosphatase
MVRPKGFEPPILGTGNLRFIQLSYGRAPRHYTGVAPKITEVYNKDMKKQSTAVYLMRDDEVLFLVRNKKNDTVHVQGHYLPVGGKVENGERIDDCAIREVAEEASVQINKLDFRGIHYIRQIDGIHDDWVVFVYTSTDFSGEPKPGNEGHFEWVHWDDMKHKPMYAGDRIYMEYFNQYDFHVAEFTYDGFEFVDVTMMYATPRSKQ